MILTPPMATPPLPMPPSNHEGNQDCDSNRLHANGSAAYSQVSNWNCLECHR